MKWSEILSAIVKKIAGYVVKVFLWLVWVVVSALHVLLRSFKATLEEVLFDTKK